MKRTCPPLLFEQLEDRTLLNAAFDLVGITSLRADPIFAGINGAGVSVAVIDTGLDRTHPLLSPGYRGGANIVTGGIDPTPVDPHGTHVAGIVGARNPEIGVAPGVGLIGLQVFSVTGNGDVLANNSDIEAALQWVLAHRDEFNIVAVNMSLGFGHFTSASQANDIAIDDVRRLEQAGVTVVSAAGNSFKDRQTQNSGAPGVYSTLDVGAVWKDGINNSVQWGGGAIDFTTGSDRLTSFSQRPNTNNVIFAPGAIITSTFPGGRLGEEAGTSQASPLVAGVVALMQQTAFKFGGRFLSPTEVASIIRATADTVFDGDDENDNVANTNVNYPRVNAHAAVKEVKRLFDQLAPPPPDGDPGSGDPNGTIAGAFLGPQLDGSPVSNVLGTIGTDGGTTNVGTKDVDIIRFQLLSPGAVTLETASNSSNPADFDTLLRLFDGSGTELASNDNFPNSLFSRIVMNLAPGTYYAGVSGAGNSQYDPNVAGSGVAAETGNFELQFSLTNNDPNGLVSGAVAVNLGNNGQPTFFNGIIGSDYGSAVGVADVDLFEVHVPDDGRLFIDIDTPFASGFVDSYLRLFDQNGQQLIFSDGDGAFDPSGDATEFTDVFFPGLVFQDPVDRQFFFGHTTDSFLAGNVTRGQVYYIGVSDFFNRAYDPNSLTNRPASGQGGDYHLYISFVNFDLNGSIPQAIDSTSQALPIVAQRGIIGADGLAGGRTVQVGDRDVDFVKIRPTQDGILEVSVDSYELPTNSAMVDTVLFLFDAQGNYLASNDDNGDSLDPLIWAEVQADQDYYVAIAGTGNDNFDPFQLGSGSPGDTGNYQFNARLLVASALPDLANDRISFSGVASIHDSETISEFIGSDDGLARGASDIDLFRYQPTRTGAVTIQTLLASEIHADTFLRVFDAAGTELAFNDNASANLSTSQVQVQVSAGQTYFIGVNGAGASARAYDPLTGAGAAAGSVGPYGLIVIPVANSGQLQFAKSSYRVLENGRSVQVAVTRTDGGDGAVSVQVVTSNGTALAGKDYNAAAGTLTWADGDTAEKSFQVTLRDDRLKEGDETIQVSLQDVSGGATLAAPDQAVITVLDDDPVRRRVSFVGSSSSGSEDSTFVKLKVTVAPSNAAVTVLYSISGGSATSGGADFTLRGSGKLVFAPGQSVKYIGLDLIDDALAEGNETIQIQLSNPTGALLGLNAVYTFTINDSNASASFAALASLAAAGDAAFAADAFAATGNYRKQDRWWR